MCSKRDQTYLFLVPFLVGVVLLLHAPGLPLDLLAGFAGSYMACDVFFESWPSQSSAMLLRSFLPPSGSDG